MTIKHLAGAWADRIGALASAEANGLVPKRRTCIQVQPPQGGGDHKTTFGHRHRRRLLLKGDAGRLLHSPANADLDAPCDVQRDEMDTAICLDRVVRIMGSIGASLADVANTTIWRTDFNQFTAFNITYAKALGGHLLARSTVALPLPLHGALVEIEAIARDPTA